MRMTRDKRKELEAKGWKVWSVEEFLELSENESTYIEIKLALSGSLKTWRETQKLTQASVAKLIHSSQPRIAKMEAGDPSVSLDLLVRSLLVLGASNLDLAKTIESSH
jgi:predicted XRE-type DNA-binding protein